MATEVTGTVDDKDTNVVHIKGADGETKRYVPESHLLAVKGSRQNLENEKAALESSRDAAVAEANSKYEAEHQKVLAAEARVSSLQEKAQHGEATQAELAQAKEALETTKKSSEELGSKLLETKRDFIVKVYGVPEETVKDKDLGALGALEEALKTVIGNKGIGNYAAGAGGGGAAIREVKTPADVMELTRDAYR